MGDKHLADVLSAEKIINASNNRICIYAGVGSGKNWFIENVLVNHGNILYVTSRRAKVNEILVEQVCHEQITWDKEIGDIVTTTNSGIEKLVMNEKFSNNFEKVINHFDFIVIDEAHSIFTDATFAESSYHVNAFIEYVATTYPIKKIILMTGTPEPLKTIESKYEILDYRDDCINVVPKTIRVIRKKNAMEHLTNIPTNQKTVYYSNSATKLVKGSNSIYRQLIQAGIKDEEIAICMSDKKANENKGTIPNLVKRCEETKQYIAENHKMPEGIRYLLTTSTLKEGINLKDTDIKQIFCETYILEDIQQFAGRVREGVDVLYIVSGAKQHSVSDTNLQEGILEYLYNRNYGLNSVNQYLESHIKNTKSVLYQFFDYQPELMEIADMFQGQHSLYSIGGLAIKQYVKIVQEHNQYIRFNHLTGQFDLFKNRLTQQKRVHDFLVDFNWLKRLEAFANENNIDFWAPQATELIDTDSIEETLSNYEGCHQVSPEKEEFLEWLSNMFCDRSNARITTINRYLQTFNIPYRLVTTYTTRNKKTTRSLKVVSANDFTK